VFTALLYGYLVAKHYYDHKDEVVYFSDKLCGDPPLWYCYFYFSRYSPSLKYPYVLTNFSYGFIGLVVFLSMWMYFEKKAKYQQIF